MRITPQTTTASRPHPSARLRAWVYARATTLGPAIAILLSFPAGGGLTAEAAAATHSIRASSAAIAPSIGAGVFGGFTSKGGPVVFELARNGKRIKRVVAAIDLRCTPSGDSFTIVDKWTKLPVRRGRFGSSFRDTFTEAGQTFEASGSVKGKLNRKRTRISGSWRSRVVVRNSAGATTDSCDSGPLRFTARR